MTTVHSTSRAAAAIGLACAALLAACGPQPVNVKTTMTFDGPQARAALKDQVPPALLASVGGRVPDVWPSSAPRLLLDLLLISRGKLDLGSAGIDPTKYGALRFRAVTAQSTVAVPLFQPQPAEYLLFVGPAGAASLSDTGVFRLARGAFASEAQAGCPGGCKDAGPLQFGQSLEVEPGARGSLQALLQSGKLELLLVLRVPIDTSVDARAPSGSVQTALELDLEFVP